MISRQTWDKVTAGYTPQKREWDHTYPWLAYGLRPASFLLTCLLLPTGVTANQITFLTLILGLAMCLGLALGTWGAMMVGALCLTLLNLFDCVDGNLARINRPTPQGRFYDGMVGYFFPLSYFFLGWGLARHPDGFWRDPSVLLLWGGIAGLSKVLTPSIRANFVSVLGDLWEQSKQTSPATVGAVGGHTGKWYYKLYYNLFDLQAHDFLLLLFIFLHAGSLFLFFSAVLGVVELVFQTLLSLQRTRRISKGL